MISPEFQTTRIHVSCFITLWFFRSRCSVVAVPQTRWTLGLWCRLGCCWVPRFPRSEMKISQDNRNKESCQQGWRRFFWKIEGHFKVVNIVNRHFSLNLLFLPIYLSMYTLHTSMLKDVYLFLCPLQLTCVLWCFVFYRWCLGRQRCCHLHACSSFKTKEVACHS